MSDGQGTIREQRLLFGLSRRAAGGIAFLVITLLVGMRAECELAMMTEYGSDPQMPIWDMLMVVKLALWLLGGGVLAGLLVAVWPKRLGSLTGIALLLVWAMAICKASWEYQRARQALADASSPVMSPDRLSDPVHFDGIQAGYELDNRLASNPTTPPDALRKLSQRGDQSGTLMWLMRNPTTPDDVLEKIRDSRP